MRTVARKGLRVARTGATVACMDHINVAAAQAIRAALAEAGLAGTAVANLIGLPATTWKRKIGGHASFTLQELLRICALLGTSAHLIVKEVEAKISERAA